MSDLDIRVEGRAGRITLTRPQVLNAISHHMCLAITAALAEWRDDPAVALVIFDAEGPRAFCAGGDLTEMYHAGRRRDFAFARDFFSDEYPMNARIHRYEKPVVAFMHGFVMGGGVGIGGNARHRVVGASSRVAMPECGIGLIPDVGGTRLLARAPGRLGLHLGITGARFDGADAIHCGFADHFLPEEEWPDLISALATKGDPAEIGRRTPAPPPSRLAAIAAEIDAAYEMSPGMPTGMALAAIRDRLAAVQADWATEALAAIARNSPLSMVSTAEMIRALGPDADIRTALAQEYRWTWRASEDSDFLEGVRAQIIDKDRKPNWRHPRLEDVSDAEVAAMLAPLGDNELKFPEETQ